MEKITHVKINYQDSPILEALKIVHWQTDNSNWQSGTIKIFSENLEDCLFEKNLNLQINEFDDFSGFTLLDGQKYYLLITLFDQKGNKISNVLEETFFYSPINWGDASWITSKDASASDEGEILFSKEIKLSKNVRSVRLYITAHGLYEGYVNNLKISENVFTPGWTSYHNQLQYQVHDITNLLKEDSWLNIRVGTGWFAGNFTMARTAHIYGKTKALLAKCMIEFEDGEIVTVQTDTSWQVSEGPVIYSNLYDGETFDTTHRNFRWLEQSSREDWAYAITEKHSKKNLVPQISEPSRVTEILQARSLFRTPNGELVLDFGQNLVGRVRISLKKLQGIPLSITLRHSEVLDNQGNVYFGNLRSAKQTVTINTNGITDLNYSSHHSFQGFRYVTIDLNRNFEVSLANFSAEVIHTDMDRSGFFVSSEPMLNQLYQNILWGQKGNFLDVPTDCPQRDERLGWTGDAQVFINTALYNFDGYTFFDKWLRDLSFDQHEDGGVPAVIPDVLGPVGNRDHSSAAWGDAAIICPWELYRFYGNPEILKQQYNSMQRWIEFNNNNGHTNFSGNAGFHFGDWLALDAEDDVRGGTSHEYIACCFHRYTVYLMVEISRTLKQPKERDLYLELLSGVDNYFVTTFFKDGELVPRTQTAHVLALKFMNITDEQRQKISEDLNSLVINRNYHLSTGFVGTPYLLEVLTENGFYETAIKLLYQKDYPSWMYSITKGATTIWEHWDSIRQDGSFWSDDMNSFNHYAYGAVGNWIYRELVGISQTKKSVGFSDVLIAPRIKGSQLDYVNGSYKSIKGNIECSWNQRNGYVEMRVKVPTYASVQLILRDAKWKSVDSDNELALEYDISTCQYSGKLKNGQEYTITYQLTD